MPLHHVDLGGMLLNSMQNIAVSTVTNLAPSGPQLYSRDACSLCGLGKHGSGAATGVSCPGELAVVLPVLVEGQLWQALLDPGCNVTLVTKAVVENFTVQQGNDLQLETMNMQHLSTQGQLQLTSLRYGDIELGPLTAYVVPTLPFKVDIVLGLSLYCAMDAGLGKWPTM